MRLDFGGRRTDGVDGADPLAQQRREQRVVRAFVFAAQDEVNAGREGGDGLGGGIDVGGLGVVVVLDAVDRGHVLQAVLDGLELLDGAANCLGRHAGQTSGNNSGQHILNVVRALERNLR